MVELARPAAAWSPPCWTDESCTQLGNSDGGHFDRQRGGRRRNDMRPADTTGSDAVEAEGK